MPSGSISKSAGRLLRHGGCNVPRRLECSLLQEEVLLIELRRGTVPHTLQHLDAGFDALENRADVIHVMGAQESHLVPELTPFVQQLQLYAVQHAEDNLAAEGRGVGSALQEEVEHEFPVGNFKGVL